MLRKAACVRLAISAFSGSFSYSRTRSSSKSRSLSFSRDQRRDKSTDRGRGCQCLGKAVRRFFSRFLPRRLTPVSLVCPERVANSIRRREVRIAPIEDFLIAGLELANGPPVTASPSPEIGSRPACYGLSLRHPGPGDQEIIGRSDRVPQSNDERNWAGQWRKKLGRQKVAGMLYGPKRKPFDVSAEGLTVHQSGAEGARTLDPRLAKPMLSQLSYGPKRTPWEIPQGKHIFGSRLAPFGQTPSEIRSGRTKSRTSDLVVISDAL